MKVVDIEKNDAMTGVDLAMLEVPKLPANGHSRKNSSESIGGTLEARETESSSLDGKKSSVVVAAEAGFIPDNLASVDGNDSELYRRRPTSSTSKRTSSTGSGQEQGHTGALTPLKSVHFPAPRE